MATIQRQVGRRHFRKNKGPKRIHKGRRNGNGSAKSRCDGQPDCIISSDGKNLIRKTKNTLKTTQFSCNLGQKFEENTADGRKTQTVYNFTNSTLV